MIDEIFTMIMTEAMRRPGDNLKMKSFEIILELTNKIGDAFDHGFQEAIERYSKSVINP